MTIKARWGNINGKGGRRKSIKYKTEWGYRGPYSSRTKCVKCLALIDTGASRSCMSSAQYKLIGSPLGAFAPGGSPEVRNRDFHGSMGVDQLPSLYRAQDVCPIVHSM